MAADPAGTAERGLFVGSHKERFFLVTFPEDVVCLLVRAEIRTAVRDQQSGVRPFLDNRFTCAALLSWLVATLM